MYIGQVVDAYHFNNRWQVTLWSPSEKRKKTVELNAVSEKIRIGDVINVHGGVGSEATIYASNEVPANFELVIEPSGRLKTVEFSMNIQATGYF